MSNLLDNPCLSRSKDGLTLIADYSNTECYVQKSTVANYYYAFSRSSAYVGATGLGYCPATSCLTEDRIVSSIPSVTGGAYSYGMCKAGDSDRQLTFYCQHKSTSYVADTDWTKLSNTIQEYREPF